MAVSRPPSPASSHPGRRAFTLLEVLVMSGIALVLMGVAWYVFHSVSAQSRKLDKRLRALQAGQLVCDRIQSDLKSYYPMSSSAWSMVDDNPPRLSFMVFREYVYDPSSRNNRSVLIGSVTYQFDRESHYLARGTELLRFAQFEDVQFGLHETRPGSVGDVSNYVTLKLTYVPEELLEHPERITDKDRVVWTSILGLPLKSLGETYDFWVRNPFDIPSP